MNGTRTKNNPHPPKSNNNDNGENPGLATKPNPIPIPPSQSNQKPNPTKPQLSETAFAAIRNQSGAMIWALTMGYGFFGESYSPNRPGGRFVDGVSTRIHQNACKYIMLFGFRK